MTARYISSSLPLGYSKLQCWYDPDGSRAALMPELFHPVGKVAMMAKERNVKDDQTIHDAGCAGDVLS